MNESDIIAGGVAERYETNARGRFHLLSQRARIRRSVSLSAPAGGAAATCFSPESAG